MSVSRIACGLLIASVAVLAACSKSEAAPSPSGEARHAVSAAAPVQETNSYKVTFEPVGTFKQGQTGIVNVVLVTKGDFHINKQYPYRFTVQDPAAAGVSYPKHDVGRDDGTFEEKRAVLPVPFVPSKTGDVQIGGTFKLSVCTDANCLMDKQQLQVTVKVD